MVWCPDISPDCDDSLTNLPFHEFPENFEQRTCVEIFEKVVKGDAWWCIMRLRLIEHWTHQVQPQHVT
jgi:hypothetical protein